MSDEKKTVNPATEANDSLTEDQLESTSGGWAIPNQQMIRETLIDVLESGKEKDKDKEKPGAKLNFI